MSNPSYTIEPQSSLPLQKATLIQTVYICFSQNHFPKHSNTLSLLKSKVKQIFQETKFQEFIYYLWDRILPDSPGSLHLKIALPSLPESQGCRQCTSPGRAKRDDAIRFLCFLQASPYLSLQSSGTVGIN